MSDWLVFEARIEPMEWGDTTFTVLRLPPDVAEALQARRVKRVEGEFNDHPVNLALSKAPVMDGIFLWTGKSLLDRTGIEPGEVFQARLRAAPDDAVDVPSDVNNGLRSAGVLEQWEALTSGRKRGHLYQIDTAKKAETRARRIAKLAQTLAGA